MRVRGLEDNRWPAALDLLLDGRGTIDLGDLVSITWWTHGVGSDPRSISTSSVTVILASSHDPEPSRRSREESHWSVALRRSIPAFADCWMSRKCPGSTYTTTGRALSESPTYPLTARSRGANI